MQFLLVLIIIDTIPVYNSLFYNIVLMVWKRCCKVYSNSANRSSEEGARGGWLPADDEEEGGVASSSPNAGASKYDSNSIGSTLVSGSN